MSLFKKFTMLMTLVITAFSLQAKSVQANEIDSTNPYEMMRTVADITFERLKAEQPKIKAEPNYLKTIVDEELMPYVNYQYAALKLLGPNLRGADKQEVQEFISEFRAYLIASYAQTLTQYSNQKIEFAPEKSVPDDRQVTSIPLEIIETGKPSIKLSFTLLKNKKTGEWKAYDMVAEGISLISSKQSEWSTKIRQEGIPAVTKELKEIATKDIVFEGKK